jgi:uncharacterized membrane protein YqjE
MAAGTDEQTQDSQRSAGQLVNDLSEQTAKLLRQELELARAELTQKGKQAGIGAGLLSGAGVFLLYAIGALTAGAILLLSRAITSWLAAVIVAAALVLIAGIAALIGKTELTRGVPPLPEQAVQTTKDDVEMVRERAREGRA